MSGDGTVTAPDGSGRQVKLITADDVVAYLKAHPDFFEKQPELAEMLATVPRAQGPGVIDMQQAILKRLRSDRAAAERAYRDHRQLQAEPDRPEPHPGGGDQHHPGLDLREDDPRRHPRAARALDVDFITMAIEANADAPKRVPVRGVYVLAPAPSTPRSAPTSMPGCAPTSPARKPSSATSPAS